MLFVVVVVDSCEIDLLNKTKKNKQKVKEKLEQNES